MSWLLQLLGLKPRPVYVVELELVEDGEPVVSIPTVTTTSLTEALCTAAFLDSDYADNEDVVVQIRKAA